jgi:hypothetical protein
VYYEIGPDVLFALSEATDGIANPPYVEKISRDGGRDAMHCVCTTNATGKNAIHCVSTNYFFPDKRVKTPDFD